MKAIMISDKPKWCALMMNGDKNIEVRTSKALANAIQKLINEQGYADIYVYCSKDGEVFYHVPTKKWVAVKSRNTKIHRLSNGVVKFKFRCYKVEEIKRKYTYNEYACVVSREWLETNTCNQEELSKKTCLTKDELFKYLGREIGYTIHVSDLEIFDKPKELSEFYNLVEETIRPDCPLKCKWWCITNYDCKYYVEDDCYGGQLACACPTKKVITKKSLTKAPKNYCYVEVE